MAELIFALDKSRKIYFEGKEISRVQLIRELSKIFSNLGYNENILSAMRDRFDGKEFRDKPKYFMATLLKLVEEYDQGRIKASEDDMEAKRLLERHRRNKKGS